MGGATSVAIAALAAILFALGGATYLAIVAGIMAVVSLWSWIQMWHFARLLARQRIYFAALQHGEFTDGSPESVKYRDEMSIEVSSQDARNVPNWITLINIVAAIAGLALLIWAILRYAFS